MTRVDSQHTAASRFSPTVTHGKLDTELHSKLHSTILGWYGKYGRDFFWRKKRGERPEPYTTLVSEVMLQQTQTSRVEQKLPVFLAQFPTIAALAAADNATIIRAWEGMGYNSRALRLRDCARAIVERHASQIPSALQDLLALPGVGAYTASAVAAFAYHEDVPVVDVNVQRVYSRVVATMPTTASVLPKADVERFAAEIFPRGRSSDWHQAVMDIGAMFCTARQPKCSSCPVQHLCASAGNMTEAKTQKRAEPSFRGRPNRIWRGRIVQMLRNADKASKASEASSGGLLRLDEVIQQLFTPTPKTTTRTTTTTTIAMLFDESHTQSSLKDVHHARQAELAWLLQIIEGLEKDRIVRLIRRPDGEDELGLYEESPC